MREAEWEKFLNENHYPRMAKRLADNREGARAVWRQAHQAELDPYRNIMGVTDAPENITQRAGVEPVRVEEAVGTDVKPGFVRVYRGEATPTNKPATPDWLSAQLKEKGVSDAAGRWWTNNIETAKWYLEDSGETGRIVYQDIPEDVWNSAASNEEALKWSPRAAKGIRDEGFLPPEYKGKGQLFDEPTLPADAGQATARPFTDAFKAWFGKSAVVDADGQPLKVYHGTSYEFDNFDVSKADEDALLGKGIYFSP
jgi:hypothetical protein